MAVSVGTMQLTLSIVIMEDQTSPAIMLLVLSATLMLVGLFIAVTTVTISVAINAVRGFRETYASKNLCSKYVGDNFYCNHASRIFCSA